MLHEEPNYLKLIPIFMITNNCTLTLGGGVIIYVLCLNYDFLCMWAIIEHIMNAI